MKRAPGAWMRAVGTTLRDRTDCGGIPSGRDQHRRGRGRVGNRDQKREQWTDASDGSHRTTFHYSAGN